MSGPSLNAGKDGKPKRKKRKREDAGVRGEPCLKCGEAEDKGGCDPMLLCDGPGCDRAKHLRCNSPPLTVVPEGDWFCSPACTKAGVCPPILLSLKNW